MYHSTLGSRVREKKKKWEYHEVEEGEIVLLCPGFRGPDFEVEYPGFEVRDPGFGFWVVEGWCGSYHEVEEGEIVLLAEREQVPARQQRPSSFLC